MSDNLVPEPMASVFDAVNRAVGDERTARRVMANPNLAVMVGADTDDRNNDKQGDDIAMRSIVIIFCFN